MIKLKVMVENKTYRQGILSEHGLSLYIETEEFKILYDTGATDILLNNSKQMNVELGDIEFAVISHGHYDHTGGIPAFIEHNDHAPVYIHKEAFHKFYGFEDGMPEKDTCGIRWTAQEFKNIEESNRLKMTEGPLWISKDVVISGTIPIAQGFIPSEQFYIRDDNGVLQPDPMSHEQFLAIRDKQAGGVHVFSGCSHTGTISCIRFAKKLFPNERILTLVGGFHLYNATRAQREEAISALIAEGVDKMIPFHCTGMYAIFNLYERLGEHCLILNAGDIVNLTRI